MKYLLGIDSGGTLTKAALYDIEGNEIFVAEEPLDTIFPMTGYNERDFNQFRNCNISVIRRVVSRSGVRPSDIIGIAVAGQGNGLYLFDENGHSVRNPILSGDMRAKEYVEKWYADGTAKKIAQKTKGSLWAGQTAVLMSWMAEHEPESMEKTKYAVTCKGYIGYLLTGKFCMEMGEASSIGCMDLEKRAFDPELLALMGIKKYFNKLVPVIESTDIAGYVSKEAAELTGLKEGTPVMGGMFDIAACAVATGVVDPKLLCVVVGTWGINEYIDDKVLTDENFFMSTDFCIQNYYLMTEGSTTSAVNLEWFIRNLMQGEKQMEQERGSSVYDLVNGMVASIKPDESSIIFLPFLFGSNVSQYAKGAFLGLSGIHTKAHMLRAVYEGVVFCHKYHIEKLFQYKNDFTKIRISGGASKSKEWVQMFADIIQLPVEVSGKTELGTMGAAMCAGVGANVYDDMQEAARIFVDVAEIYEPNPVYRKIYEEKYRNYKEILKALNGTWENFKN